jgi:hypothetical protein
MGHVKEVRGLSMRQDVWGGCGVWGEGNVCGEGCWEGGMQHDTGLTASTRMRMMSLWFFSAAKVRAVSPVPLECMQMWSSEGS